MKRKILEIYNNEDGDLRIEYRSPFLAAQGISKGALGDDQFETVLLAAAADYFSFYIEGDEEKALRNFVKDVMSLIPTFRETNKELRAEFMRKLGAS